MYARRQTTSGTKSTRKCPWKGRCSVATPRLTSIRKQSIEREIAMQQIAIIMATLKIKQKTRELERLQKERQ